MRLKNTYRNKIMKKDYRLGFKYELPLTDVLFLGFGYFVFAGLFLYNKPIGLIISTFCVGFTLFIAMKRYNKYLSQRYKYKINIIIDTGDKCLKFYIYTNMFSIDDDGTVYIFLKKKDKRNPITTVYRKDDNKTDRWDWLPEDYISISFEYNSITDNFEKHIFSAEELKEMIFKITENTVQINKK